MSTEQLKNLDETSGAKPRTRVSDGGSARAIALRLIENNKPRNRRNSLVQGLIDGNPPYSRTKLKENGQSYRANFNDNQALSVQEAALTAYYDLFSEVPYFCEVKPDTGDPETDAKLGRLLTQEFHDLQTKDPGMEDLINVSHHEMVTYGAGPVIFESADDWAACPVKYDDFLLDNNEPSEMAKWTKVLVRDTKTVSQLMEKIENEEAAAARGWNVEAVKKSIIRASEHNRSSLDGTNWQKTQERIRQNDLNYTDPDRSVHVGRLFFKEFPSEKYPTGGITEVAVDLDSKEDGFLYQEINKYESWEQVGQAFMLNRGTGKYHSIKGVGVRMYSVLQTKLRLDNSVVDSAFFMSSIHAKKKAGGPTGTEGHVYLGPITMWKQDYEPMNFQNPAAGIEAAASVSAQMDNKLQGNLSQFRPDPNKPIGNPRTATEVAAIVQQQSVLTKTAIARYFAQLDGYYRERWRRATTGPLNSRTVTAKLASEWRAKLAARGITPELLRTCKVAAVRTVGQGSHFLRQQTLSMLWQGVAGIVPEGGKQALLDDMIASHAGYERVERYNPKNNVTPTEQRHQWEAKIENGIVMSGGSVSVTDTQDDFIHAATHLEEVQSGLAAIGQGTDPSRVVMFGMEIQPHISEHIQRITDDPLRANQVKQLVAAAKTTFNQLEQLVGMLQQESAAQQQEGQQAEQEGQATSLEMLKTQAELAQKQEKHEQMIRHAEERHTQERALRDEQVADQIRQTE